MPSFPGERALRAERAAFVRTLEALPVDVFDGGPTLCAGWAPRDVLAHVLGIDDLARGGLDYIRGVPGLGRGNARQVARYRGWDRGALLAKARTWAARPALVARVAAFGLLGDNAVHHQDVLRANGIDYDPPAESAAAVLREGIVLGAPRLLTHRVVPDGGRAVGVGRTVRGPAVALGMWLAGRTGYDDELTFS